MNQTSRDRDNSRRVRTHEKNSGETVRRLGTIIQSIFVPNQEPASAWIFGNSSVRVGTQRLFRPYLKTFVPPFLPARLTAPGSPKMSTEKSLYIRRYYTQSSHHALRSCSRRNFVSSGTSSLFHNVVWAMSEPNFSLGINFEVEKSAVNEYLSDKTQMTWSRGWYFRWRTKKPENSKEK